jgi:hypothetical protein
MTEQPKRRGGWPGPAKPKWTFRPTPEAQAAVAAHLDAEGLDPERDRSKAINALLARTAKPDTEETR